MQVLYQFGAWNMLLIGLLITPSLVDADELHKTKLSLRLPRHLLPSHYRIKLIPFLSEGNFTTSGEVWITLTCVESSNLVVFNNNNITIQKESVSLQDIRNREYISVLQQEYNNETQKYTLMVSSDLKSGNQYLLYMKFTSYLNDLLEGFYRSSYIDKEIGKQRWLATSQFSPTDARRAFPSWDEPNFKANFTISLGRQLHMCSWSNMPINSTIPMEGMEGWFWDNYPMTLPMSTYLVAFMVSDLQSSGVVTLPSGPKFQTIATKDELSHTKYAASVGPKILVTLEDYFNIKFPLPKIDMVAVPDFGFSAMENWGFITFRESVLLYDPEKDSINTHEKAALVIAHELSHQWFGNLVTPDWWEDLWLKEGFATYIGCLTADKVEPERRFKERFVVDDLQFVMLLDALNSSHPISVPVDDTKDITQIFDSISYKKGASIIRMMHHFMGKQQFKEGLTAYLEKFAYKNANQDQLWQVLTAFNNESGTLPNNVTVKNVMDSWTLQVGYPVVTVTRSYESGSTKFRQNRFLESKSVEDGSLWWIPLSYTTQQEANFQNTQPRVWLSKTEHSIEVLDIKASNWLLVNINETGFYRVNYDERNWAMLTADFGNLPELTRAQLLNDAMYLAAAGLTSYRIALNLTKQLYFNHSYFTWTAVNKAFSYIHDMLVGTQAFPTYKEYLLKLLRVNEMNMTLDPASLSEDSLVRLHFCDIVSIALKLDYAPLVAEIRNLTTQWMAGADFKISPDLKRYVYCSAIRNGDEKVWEFFWSLYLKSKAVDRLELLIALGCSRNEATLSRYLNMLLEENSKIRKQDGTVVFSNVASNKDGFQLAFNFITERWMDIQKHFGLGFNRVSGMVSSLSRYLNTPQQLQQLQDLRDSHLAHLGSTAQAMSQAIEKVSNNIAWRENHFHEVEAWLSQTVATL